MSSVRPSYISEETYNKVFELVGLPTKVGFPFALNKLLEKLTPKTTDDEVVTDVRYAK
jgi:hypothetical protein